ncbi:MAG: hypothetical protein Unbinned2819contig1000_12 [Prokaryotic dsDNA virus sp.]|nr:MAG: hypothetical protein Unbinned2819contig1000_12 [Prokaryotic dsDNA virus sp.]|tara:strand:- start:3023 stop:3292 length:270 start_codon:yes stop_codon:yes gene_type:complete
MPAIPNTAELVDQLKASVEDPQNKLIVADLAAHVTRIATMALTDPNGAERELQFVKAATANLAAAEATRVQSAIVDWLSQLIRAAIVGA